KAIRFSFAWRLPRSDNTAILPRRSEGLRLGSDPSGLDAHGPHLLPRRRSARRRPVPRRAPVVARQPPRPGPQRRLVAVPAGRPPALGGRRVGPPRAGAEP